MEQENLFDTLTKTLGTTVSRRGALKVMYAVAAGGILASLGVGCRKTTAACPSGTTACGDDCCGDGETCLDGVCQSDLCPVASACGSRQYCNEEETCICVQSAEGINRCGQLPSSCDVQLCQTSEDCANLGEGYFCDTPNSGCCTDPPAELPRCIAPCGVTAPPPCPDERVCGEVCCQDGQNCIDGACTVPTGPVEATLLLSGNPNNGDLLFFSRQPDGNIFYQGSQEAEGFNVSYVTLEDQTGTQAAMIFNRDYLPIQWMMDGVTIQVRRSPGEAALDPMQALHIFLEETGEKVRTLAMWPTNLAAILDQIELEEGETFEEARGFLQTTADTYTDVLALIRAGGDDQPRLIAAAIGFSTAASAIAFPESFDEAGFEPAQSTGIARRLGVGIAKKMLKNALKDRLKDNKKENPDVPTVGVLRCRGATIIPKLCHNAYFIYSGSAFPCLDLCFVTTDCFTDICMPERMSRDNAEGYRANF